MSEKNPAIFQFIGYRVTNILYECDSTFEFPEGKISYKFNFAKCTTKLSNNQIQENLKVNVFFSENNDMEQAPYKLSVEIAGRFVSIHDWQPQWEMNALSILFPYLRGIVSFITSNSGREPIILPTINIVSLFEESE